MRNLLALASIVLFATAAYAYSTGDWKCVSGACTIGASTITGVTTTTDGASLNLEGTTAETLTLSATSTNTAVFQGADATGAANTQLDTTGAGTITIGSADVTGVTTTTDGASLNVEGTTANTLTLAAATTGTAIFQGADAAGGSNTALDTTGIGTITIGSADVTAVTIITDGGTTTIDGNIQGDIGPIVSLASGALTVNTINVATAAATYTMPDCEAANIGEWVTVVVRDVSEVVILDPATGDTLSPAGAIIAINEVMDSAGAATSDGDFVTFACLVADIWHSTAIGGAWVDGGAS